MLQKILRPLYDMQRRVRPTTRPAIQARDEGRRFRRQSSHWSEVRRTEWILARLRSVCREAAAAPFYRDWFARADFQPSSEFGFDDFARLPILDRETVRSEVERMKIPGVTPRLVRKDATGGSTGQPTEVYKGPRERGWQESGGDYFMSRIGCPRGSPTALLWGHHLDPVASGDWRDRLRTWIANERWFDCLRISDDRFLHYHRELQAWRPDCIVAYANALAPLAEVAAGEGEVPGYPTRCLVTGAEKLMTHDRERVQEVFGRPVHERYGSRDVGLIGFQTDAPHDLSYEIDWSNVLVEPLNDEPMSPILITKLHGDAMAMIRYRTGDLGRFPEGSKPGHPVFRLEEVVGREVDRIWLPDGGWFHAVGIPHMMKDLPVRHFRLVQEADYSITMEVVVEPEFTDRHRGEILTTLAANVPGVSIDVQVRKDLPRTASGKLRPVISRVDRAEPRVE